MTHLAALLSFSASKNNDAIGLLLFSDQIEHFVPPKKGRGHVHRILRDLYYHQPKSKRTKLSVGLEYLQGILKKRSSIFLFSDFMDSGFEETLRLLGKKHDLAAVVVNDPFELKLPSSGLVDFEDAETGEVITVDLSSSSFRSSYEQQMMESKKLRDSAIRQAQVERIDVSTEGDFVNPLIQYFKRRSAR